ncbi:hypothetical protein GW17_00017880 [Ensete ventricosum]|nr:hypothetical protein GW17_00017880 [Ensete ventricosum]
MRVSLAEVEPAERTSLCGSNLTLFPLNSPMKSASACTCWRSKVSIDMRKRKRCQSSFKRSTTYFLESRQAMIVLEKSQFPEDESAVSPEPHGVGVALQPRLDEIERELHRTIALAGGYTGREKKTKQEEVSSMDISAWHVARTHSIDSSKLNQIRLDHWQVGAPRHWHHTVLASGLQGLMWVHMDLQRRSSQGQGLHGLATHDGCTPMVTTNMPLHPPIVVTPLPSLPQETYLPSPSSASFFRQRMQYLQQAASAVRRPIPEAVGSETQTRD